DVPPSFDEMRDALGLASKSGVHRLVSGLEERGYIRRLANRARAIEILKPVTAAASGVVTRAVETASNLVSLPLLGRIAAGTPIEALSDPTNHLEIPASMIGSGEHFALEIVGDSMMGAGILDGDTVVIQRAETARHGEIVVALINQQEATLKTLLKEPGRVGLEAANPRYETRYFSTGEVEVQGKLAGLIRNY
ncbi:transcriptional repressor LexA, partial [Alphaproteobacteria bacterium]|nr:transcriptional repressor LexA [Alphaproteobacteria bacterium]